jgi:hypothetical protein
MEIEELLEISSEIRDSIRTYITETEDYGDIIVRRERATGEILIKDVPILVCMKCREEWYPPRILKGLERR